MALSEILLGLGGPLPRSHLSTDVDAMVFVYFFLSVSFSFDSLHLLVKFGCPFVKSVKELWVELALVVESVMQSGFVGLSH